jgi:hypothetical protein
MWKPKPSVNVRTTKNVRLVLPEDALKVIFDECDGFDRDETGGRVVGTFEEQGDKLTLRVTGMIESGPKATRSPVSFFQDGEHQERIFRQIERNHPEIEHLGNWHTHHVNGLSTLSGGDITTYRKTVNHPNHNTPFFYALLVVAKHNTTRPLQRYSIKHFIFRRNDDTVYEIPQRDVEIIEAPLLWPADSTHHGTHVAHSAPEKLGANPQRVYDRDVIGEFYEGIRSFSSEKLGLYWRGTIELVDGAKAEVVLVEDSSSRAPTYSVTLWEPGGALATVAEQLTKLEFPSARAALMETERRCNRALFTQLGHSRGAKSAG